MSKIKVQLDEDVNPLLARDLRDRGYDAISAGEANTLGLSDRHQLDYACTQGRAFLTHNRDDFLEIAIEYAINQIAYPAFFMSRRFPTRNSFIECCVF
jgi:predicted nuclease of predicted toxin-antitoxin system